MSVSSLAIDALLHKYTAQMKDATFVLSNYLNNPAAIGEHPQLLEEMDNAVENYVNAQDKFNALLKLTQEKKDAPKKEPTLFEGMD